MRIFLLILSVGALLASPATAHCGKPHPDGKEKTPTTRPLPKPE